ncbi:MAG TPA: sugar transferase [Chitinophagaceae bacterium]|nr:sugar transferase [Chitinophagaceae bacterium]
MDKEGISNTTSESSKRPDDFIAIIGGRHVAFPSDRKPIYPVIVNFLGEKELTSLSLNFPLDSLLKRIIKRSIDLIVSSIVIAGLLVWIIPLLAIIIKTDSKGPVFFLQKRNKRNGGVFTCIKFRSMVNNDAADILAATVNDARITRLGKFLRIHYLDELPQFFNVWLGDMSFIGPRPHMIQDNLKFEELIDYYDDRHKVKPGITGLAQVLGYVGETSNIQRMRDRVQLDLFYVRHWSLLLDIKITLHTIRKIF